MNLYKIINPSDGVLLASDDDTLVAVTVLRVSEGTYGVKRLDTGADLSMYTFGGNAEMFRSHLKELGIDHLGDYIDANMERMADLLETVTYGITAADYQELENHLNQFPANQQLAERAKWNDKRRSSMNDIGWMCLENARRIRAFLAKETP